MDARELRKYRNRPDLRPHFDERDMVCNAKQVLIIIQSIYAGMYLPTYLPICPSIYVSIHLSLTIQIYG